MAHVVTERCVDCRYTDCCAVCPVDCFYETTSPAMLVINPDVCIDCALCVPACPIAAIWPEDELPEQYKVWTDKNRSLWENGTQITKQKAPLPTAVPLADLQAREKSRGWTINEPSGAGEGGGEAHAPAAEGETAVAVEEAPAEAVEAEAPVAAAPPPKPAAPKPVPALAEVRRVDPLRLVPQEKRLPVPAGLSEAESAIFNATANSVYRWRTVRGIARAVRLPQGTVQGEIEKLVSQGHLQKHPPKSRGLMVYGPCAKVA